MSYSDDQCFLSMGFAPGGVQFCALQTVDPNAVLQAVSDPYFLMQSDTEAARRLAVKPVSLLVKIGRVAPVQLFNNICNQPERWYSARHVRTEPYRNGGGLRLEGCVLAASADSTDQPEPLSLPVDVRMFLRTCTNQLVDWAYLQPLHGIKPGQFPIVDYLPVTA